MSSSPLSLRPPSSWCSSSSSSATSSWRYVIVRHCWNSFSFRYLIAGLGFEGKSYSMAWYFFKYMHMHKLECLHVCVFTSLKDPSQPPSFSTQSKLLILHGEANSYYYLLSRKCVWLSVVIPQWFPLFWRPLNKI